MIARSGDLTGAEQHLSAAIDTISERWRQPTFFAQVRMAAIGVGLVADALTSMPTGGRAVHLQWAGALRDRAQLAAAANEQRFPPGPEGKAWLVRLQAEWARLLWVSGSEDALTAEQYLHSWTAATSAFGYGARYEQARCRARLAAAYRAAGDLAAAAEAATKARDVARAVGAEPILAQLAGLAVPVRARGEPSTALTPRESEVLVLIADGNTNRQIARSLYISEKTVSVHVSNVLAKLGAAGRTEAVAVARRQGVLD
jgi:DNA-binding CsgD family transcriptional regulator